MATRTVSRFGELACLISIVVAGCSGTSDQPPPAPSLESIATMSVQAIAADPAGNLYLIDNNAPHNLLKITGSGTVAMLALQRGGGVALGPDGRVYAGDTPLGCGDLTVWRITPDGASTALRPTGSSNTNTFFCVSGIAVDVDGNVYVSDDNQNMIRKLSPGGELTFVAGIGPRGGAERDGVGAFSSFDMPRRPSFDRDGNLLVCDASGQTIRKVTPSGVVTTIAGIPYISGDADGPAMSATFNFPSQAVMDSSGTVYVADAGNSLIRKIAPSGQVSTVAGTRGMRGFSPGPLPGGLDSPVALALVGRSLFIASSAGVQVIRNLPN